MKLLVVSHACATPLNQQFFVEVAALAGWDIDLVTPSNWKTEYGAVVGGERYPTFRGNVYPIPVWFSGNVPLHVYRSTLTDVLRESKPDVIFVHHEPYAAGTAQVYYANRRANQVPIGFFTWQNILKKYPFPFDRLERFVLAQSDFAFPGSESARQVIESKGYAGPSALLPAGIDPTLYRPAQSTSDVRVELGVSQGELLIGYVGRIIRDKGLLTLIRSLSTLADLKWRIVFVGTGPLTEELSELADSLGIGDRIVQEGFVERDAIPTLMSALDVFVIPSETQPNWKEQFGRVIIEAMACGTPVVGSNSGEIPFLIERTGGGLVFEERKADSLSHQLRLIMTDKPLRIRLGRQGKETVLAQFTNAAVAGRFVDLIDAVLDRQGSDSEEPTSPA